MNFASLLKKRHFGAILRATLLLVPCTILFAQCIQELDAKKPGSEYQSDSDASYLALETWQKKAYESAPVRHHRPPTVEELVRAFQQDSERHPERKEGNEANVSQLRKLKLPTRCEHPMWYLVMDRLRDRIMKVVPQKPMVSTPRIIFGTLPSRSVSSWVREVPCQVPCTPDRIAVFHQDLFDATYQVTKTLMLTFDWNEHGMSFERGKIIKRINDGQGKLRFAEVMKWYVTGLEPTQYDMEPKQEEVITTFVRAMEMFAIAHEYAHVILGHVPQRENLPYSWLQELQADRLGFELMVSALNGGSKSEKGIGFWGAAMMLDVMDILERADAIARTGQIPPPPMPDDAGSRMTRWVEVCLQDENSVECKTLRPKDSYMIAPPLWYRSLRIRNRMHEMPELGAIVNDTWDFEQAFKFGGMMLLRNAAPLLQMYHLLH